MTCQRYNSFDMIDATQLQKLQPKVVASVATTFCEKPPIPGNPFKTLKKFEKMNKLRHTSKTDLFLQNVRPAQKKS